MSPTTTTANGKHIYKNGDPNLTIPEGIPSGPPSFSDKYKERAYLKHRLALAFRIFAKAGFRKVLLDTSPCGILSIRTTSGSILWVSTLSVIERVVYITRIGLHFSLITPSDLILVNYSGTVIDGGKNRFLNYAAFAIHSKIHSARPDVAFAAHLHCVYGRAICATGQTLDPIMQDSCNFYNGHSYVTFISVYGQKPRGMSGVARPTPQDSQL
ncbi:hypothetical protein OIDMADRAFT_61174 [Oidiodendron maius Zn]|uniref:Class II aldolase/adducin N-terminal domain-containing protein n=1 Tax=Oidiodendron maius (strain Zn) TaxID=913774 RepID=A0A0C3C4R9_OIDMZ|nr:hypothetical protein OIDMADRAFT_61174 [Oidiodendron maius Zn]